MQELVTINEQNALTLFTKENGLDPVLQKIRDEVISFVPDVTTKKGRDEIASLAHKVARSKTRLDDLGKALTEDWARKKRTVDAERKRVRDFLDALKEDVRRPLTEWEKAEENRIFKIKSRINYLNEIGAVKPNSSSDFIKTQLNNIENFIVDVGFFQEFLPDVINAHKAAHQNLKQGLVEAEKREAEQAELERLRKAEEERMRQERQAYAERERLEREERIRKEAELKAKREAERHAQVEREAAERRELELKLQAERAERLKEQAQKEALEAAKKERERIEAEQKAKAEAEAKRQADIEHRKKINQEIIEAFELHGIDLDSAQSLVAIISNNNIPHLKIIY